MEIKTMNKGKEYIENLPIANISMKEILHALDLSYAQGVSDSQTNHFVRGLVLRTLTIHSKESSKTFSSVGPTIETPINKG